MKDYPLKEIKKKSTKPKYCTFTGKVQDIPTCGKIPKKIKCPACQRRLEPTINTCTGSYEDASWACCVYLTIKKHRAKK